MVLHEGWHTFWSSLECNVGQYVRTRGCETAVTVNTHVSDTCAAAQYDAYAL